MIERRLFRTRQTLRVATLTLALGFAGAAQAQAPAEAERGWLDRFNTTMHGFNQWSVQSWRTLTGTGAPPHEATKADATPGVVPSMLLNLINEPVSALSWSIAGDSERAVHSLHRFWTNTTRGWLGARDVAAAEGRPADHIDIGLALCARGVSEGGYIVLPFIGARTARDGLADFIFTNAATFAALSPFIGFPPSPSSFLTVEILEEALRIPAIRQIDSSDESSMSMETVRDRYLEDRRKRCDSVRAHIETANVQPR